MPIGFAAIEERQTVQKNRTEDRELANQEAEREFRSVFEAALPPSACHAEDQRSRPNGWMEHNAVGGRSVQTLKLVERVRYQQRNAINRCECGDDDAAGYEGASK